MSLFRAIRSLCSGTAHWVRETYCALGQKVGERLEDAADAMAERHYHATARPQDTAAPLPPSGPVIEMTEYRVINGHRHSD